uniref:CD80-like immunoglobulin C2-set domain-containing protein n=1 Tax=Oncorhynchus mykiss TaxID=8022 RepID=A0A8C7V278_ONCMY
LVTGIIGESVLLPCDLNLSINPARLRFHWQDHSDVVLYSFNNRVEQEYQNELYTNRTNAFQVEMSSGNISIELKQVTPQDNQKTYWAFALLFDRNDQPIHFTKVCQTTLLVAARFPTPKLTVKYKVMNAMCLTQGGYPKPKVTWTIQDLSQPQNGTLEPREVQTNFTLDPESGLYTVWSQVNFTENYIDNHSVTCQVFNPVLRETVSNTTIIRTSVHKGKTQESLVRDETNPSLTRMTLGQLCVAPRTSRLRPVTTEPGRKPRDSDGTAGAAVQRP